MILIVTIIIITSIALSVILGNNIAGGIARPLNRLSARFETFAQATTMDSLVKKFRLK